MVESKFRVVNSDGIGRNTDVYIIRDGKPIRLEGVNKVEIGEIYPDGLVQLKIGCLFSQLDISALPRNTIIYNTEERAKSYLKEVLNSMKDFQHDKGLSPVKLDFYIFLEEAIKGLEKALGD